jgi:hypothetical protein
MMTSNLSHGWLGHSGGAWRYPRLKVAVLQIRKLNMQLRPLGPLSDNRFWQFGGAMVVPWWSRWWCRGGAVVVPFVVRLWIYFHLWYGL